MTTRDAFTTGSSAGGSNDIATGGSALPETMRAARRVVYGTAADVIVAAAPRPEPAPGEVLIRVAAAGLDRATLHLLDGRPLAVRLALGLRRPRQTALGQQVAGEVVTIGDDVTTLAIGDRVCGTAIGSFADYAIAKPRTLARIPHGVSDPTAATLGVSGATAHQALVAGQVGPGQHVLIIGASGAVGTYAVQLAAHLGAHVTAVCSAGKIDLVKGLGAQRAFDYRAASLADTCGGDQPAYDVIIDLGGNRRLRDLRFVLAPEGRLILAGGEEGGPLLGGIERNLYAAIANVFTCQHLAGIFSAPTTEKLTTLVEVVAQAGIEPPVDRLVGLDGLPAGIEAMQRGELRGHVVVVP